MKRILSLMLALCLCIGAAIPAAVPAFADAAGLLELRLGATEVKQGDSLSFTGKATLSTKPVASLSVTITVFDSKGEPARVFEKLTTAGGEFAGTMVLPENDIIGTYTVKAVANIGGEVVVRESNFLVKSSHHQSVLTTDRNEYTIGSVMNVTGKAMIGDRPLANQDIPIKLMLRGEAVYVTQARVSATGDFNSSFRLVLREAGSYQLVASIPGAAGIGPVELTKAITIVDNPILSTVSVNINKQVAYTGENLTVSGRITMTGGNDPVINLANQTVTLKLMNGNTEVLAMNALTSADGSFSKPLATPGTGSYTVVASFRDATSSISLEALPVVARTLTISLPKANIELGDALVVNSKLVVTHNNVPLSNVGGNIITVSVYKGTEVVKTQNISTIADGSASVSLAGLEIGQYTVKAVHQDAAATTTATVVAKAVTGNTSNPAPAPAPNPAPAGGQTGAANTTTTPTPVTPVVLNEQPTPLSANTTQSLGEETVAKSATLTNVDPTKQSTSLTQEALKKLQAAKLLDAKVNEKTVFTQALFAETLVKSFGLKVEKGKTAMDALKKAGLTGNYKLTGKGSLTRTQMIDMLSDAYLKMKSAKSVSKSITFKGTYKTKTDLKAAALKSLQSHYNKKTIQESANASTVDFLIVFTNLFVK